MLSRRSYRDHPAKLPEVQLDHLQEARKVGHAQDLLRLMAPHESEHLPVLRSEELERAPSKRAMPLAQSDQPPHPRQQRMRILGLGLDVDAFEVVFGVGHHRQIEALAVGPREAGVAVAAPLHRRADPIAVAKKDVVAHSDLVAVVEDRRSGQREQQAVHQLDAPPVVAEKGRQAATDAEVDACGAVLRVGPVHVVALLVGHHLERELVVVPQEQRPLCGFWDRGGLGQDVDDREAVFHADRHEQARHEREVERHVALIALAEVGDRVLGPLVGFGEEHAVRMLRVDVAAQLTKELVRLGQVLAVGPVALKEVGDGVQSHPVDAGVEPEVARLEDGLANTRVVEVQVRLVRVEPMPVVGVRQVVPGPVGDLEVFEDDPGVAVLLVGRAPDEEVAC